MQPCDWDFKHIKVRKFRMMVPTATVTWPWNAYIEFYCT